jgi:4-amino-4-deoxy-L-arabinose transferase-like glycosyltransferase
MMNTLQSAASRTLLIVSCLVFIILGWMYNAASPYRTEGQLMYQRAWVTDIGAPDERAHASYLSHLLDGKGLPVMNPKSPDFGETYQSHQPPLYYVLAAGWCKIVGADPTDKESGFRIRFLNTLIGVATLIGIFQLCFWGLRSTYLGTIAVVLTAGTPMFLSLHGAISNDPLLICLCTWALALMGLAVREGWTPRRSVVLGLVVGAALLTKTSGFALIPVLFLLFLWTRKKEDKVPWTLVSMGIAILIVLPIWMRNTNLYGDAFGLKAFKEAFAGSAQRADLVKMVAQMREQNGLSPEGASTDYWVNWFGWWTARSYVGVFSQMDIFFSDLVYRVLLSVAGFLGLTGWFSWWKPRDETESGSRRVGLLLLVFFSLVFLQFLQFNLTYFQAQARYLYPAVVAVSIPLALGIRRLAGERAFVAYGLLAAMFFGNLLSLSYIRSEFERRTNYPKPVAGPSSQLDSMKSELILGTN